MKKNETIYAIIHGTIIKAVLLGLNDHLGIAYVESNGRHMRIMSDSIFPTHNAAQTVLATL